jgi:hypothetical protein
VYSGFSGKEIRLVNVAPVSGPERTGSWNGSDGKSLTRNKTSCNIFQSGFGRK